MQKKEVHAINPADLGHLAIYQNPPVQFSPVPMWFWNDQLDAGEIRRQILSFHHREVDAFMIHPRMGLPRSLPYLSDAYLDFVACAVDMAAHCGMTVFLYDEAMYPSGSAHGQVVAANPAFAAQALIRVVLPDDAKQATPSGRLVHRMLSRDPSGRSIDIAFFQTCSGGKIRGVHFGEDSGQPDAPPAADLMNPAAMACFISLTHERYYQRLSPWFGTSIQAFFTDEPSLLGRGDMTGKIPWTEGLLDQWTDMGMAADDLDALFPESHAYDPVISRTFAGLCRRRLSRTYYEPLSRWCSEHGIALTGHPAESDDIGLLRHFQIPGQDLVLRWVGPEADKGLTGRNSTLAKCCADAARHAGRSRNAVECFGCCVRNQPSKGWDLPPEDMKWYLDWLAVRGVNLFIPHAFYYSLCGRRAEERPPDVGPAQTWWSEYHYWSRYMKRLSHLMSECVTINPVAVLCTEDHLPWQIARTLYEHQLDFNYLEESYLTGTARIGDGCLMVGPYTYRRILVENPALFGKKTQDKLAECRAAGIEIDCLPDQQDKTGQIWLQNLLSEAPIAVHDLADPAAHPDALRITCQQRGDDRFILMTNEGMTDLDYVLTIRFCCDRPILWDPWSGAWSSVQATGRASGLEVSLHLLVHQSLVLLFPGAGGGVITLNGQIKAHAGQSCGESAKQTVTKQPLSDNWLISFAESSVPASFTRSELVSWQHLLADPYYSGKAVYTTCFRLDAQEDKAGAVVLDLGEVHDVATVTVNGMKIDTVFWQPYRYDVTGAVQAGDNTLEVTVMNSISCRMDHIAKPSGLLGPVSLEITHSDLP